MALQVWLPLNGNLNNQGLTNVTVTNNGATVDNNGKIGKCYNFDGTYVSFNRPLPNPCSAFTVCGWVKLSTGYAANNGLHLVSFETSYGRICISKDGHAVRVLLNYNGTTSATGSIAAASSISANVWNHYAVTFDLGKINIYINGQLDNSYTINLSQVSIASSILKVGTYNSESSKGCVNDFRLYDHALSPKEVKELSKGLVCHYPLNDRYIENTTNLIDVSTVPAGTISGWGGHTGQSVIVDASDYPIPCNECNKFAITYSGSGGGGCGWRLKRVTSTPSTTYTYSCYIKTYSLNANILYIYEYKSDGTKIREVGLWSTTNMQYIQDGWYRIWGTFTTDATSGYFDVYNFVYPNITRDYYIGCWQLEEKDHMTPYVFGSRAETTVYDCSGYQNNGTVSGSLTTSNDTARYSYSTLFTNGTANYTNTSLVIGENKGFTMSLWMKSTDGSAGYGNYHILASIESSQYEMSMGNGGRPRIGFNISGTRYVADYGDVNCLDKKWHMITMTYDGNNIKAYVDGENVGTTARSGTLATGTKSFRLGNYMGTTYGDKNILKSDVRIYATALSAEQVAELYNTAVSVANNGTLMGYELVEV